MPKSSTKNQSQHPFPQGARVPGVELFTLGTHRDNPYTPDDFKAIELNFKRFSAGPDPIHNVPAVLGHSEEDEQKLLKQEGLPAAAWVKTVTFSGPLLVGDLDEMHGDVARLVAGKAYRKVSPEIYDYPPEGVPGDRSAILQELQSRHIDPRQALEEARAWARKQLKQAQHAYDLAAQNGVPEEQRPHVLSYDGYVDDRLRQHLGPMLRRVALLGADIPQDRKLKDLPAPIAYSETHPGQARPGRRRQFASGRPVLLKFSERKIPGYCCGPRCWSCFSEVLSMPSRDELIQMLTSKGVNPDLLEGLSEPALAEWVRSLDGAQASPEPGQSDDGSAAPDQAPPPSPDEEGQKMAEHPGGDEAIDIPSDDDGADAEAQGDYDAPYAGMGDSDGDGEEDLAEGDMDGDEGDMDGEDEDPTEKYAAYDEDEEGMEEYDEAPEVSAVTGMGRPRTRKMMAGCKSYSEVNARLAAVNRRLAQAEARVKKYAEAQEKQARAALKASAQERIDSTLKSLSGSGHIKPADVDGGKYSYLFDLPCVAVRKYSEGGKVYSETPLDNALRQLRKLKEGAPVKSFAEKVKADPPGTKTTGPASTDDGPQVKKVREHFKTYSEVFSKQGTSEKDLVDGFLSASKHQPGLTAETFLGKTA